MGNHTSRVSVDHDVFAKELSTLNNIVTNIISEKDVFVNKDYNFLSQDVCKSYQVVMEEELEKHLKLTIKKLGASLYLIPRAENTKMEGINLTKQEICSKISNHYIKILYIMSLIKYVYNLERNGDMSVAGIIVRNIRVLDDIMEINFCELPHRDYRYQGVESKTIDFGALAGFSFFVHYVLTPEESSTFMSLLRTVLLKPTKGRFAFAVCQLKDNKKLTPSDLKEFEELYQKRFGSRLNCKKKQSIQPQQQKGGNISLRVHVAKDNPIFSRDHCFSARKFIVKTSTKEGQRVLSSYNTLLKNYSQNVHSIEELLKKIVTRQSNGIYTLKDIDRIVLDEVIEDVKIRIKTFYLQSILDFHSLLDTARLIPKIEFSDG
jgi:hypothetical protein